MKVYAENGGPNCIEKRATLKISLTTGCLKRKYCLMSLLLSIN